MHVLENAILVQQIVKYMAIRSKVGVWLRERRFITESNINRLITWNITLHNSVGVLLMVC